MRHTMEARKLKEEETIKLFIEGAHIHSEKFKRQNNKIINNPDR